MNIFFTPDISGAHATLSEEESMHCIRVLRHRQGDLLTLIDGKGTLYKATITEANPKSCGVEVVETFPGFEQRNYHLHVAIAPTKNIDRFEWFLEKATEIGIDEITPLLCEHSERKQLKPERLEKILVSAMKQSLKASLPRLNNFVTFDSLIKTVNGNNTFMAHCYPGEKMHLARAAKGMEKVLVMIGPEGDFSLNEVAAAKARGCREVTLGQSRLRTETAGITAVSMINVLNEQA
ncbi:MAG: 16S rRNA (uracil(1498)-N(3))-methyltransferase [Prolixibacteraceae bacterium]|nr:16S rRNA (uracil(1498)-N(3))-methyltransferase [Prolixibacteraceae bacterium]